ncbi:MAG TPA: AraC family transcriptional regulator [Flavobacteriaceae bacterium]|nr:AraC family transcriptional regulator [Flavobacteriaceae bacterium]
MILHLVFNPVETATKFIEDLIRASGVKVKILGNNQYVFAKEDSERYEQLISGLEKFGIQTTRCPKVALITRVKHILTNMIEEGKNDNLSDCLPAEINLSYPQISKIFKEETFMSLEDYLIFLKIQKVRKLVDSNLSLTEISYRLGYSSVAHLSRQFKQKTGMTFKEYQKLQEKRFSQQ